MIAWVVGIDDTISVVLCYFYSSPNGIISYMSYPTACAYDNFYVLKLQDLYLKGKKTLREKKKMLVTTILSVSNYVFYKLLFQARYTWDCLVKG